MYESTRIGGPHHKSIQPPSPSKKKLLTNQRQIQGSKGQMTYQTKQKFRGTQRSNTRAHLLVVQMKEGPRGRHLGPADPLGCPTPYWAQTGPSFACRLLPHCLCQPPMVPPQKFTEGSTLGGLYKEEESPPFNTQQEEQSSTPRRSPTSVVLRNGEREWGSSEGHRPVGALLQLVPRQMLPFLSKYS